jgi:hypothetical protein
LFISRYKMRALIYIPMSDFSTSQIPKYIMTLGIIILVSYFSSQIKNGFIASSTNEEEELIRRYLLNDSPLYGYNRPKLWIHSKYEVNSRTWKSFQSRNTTDLNQPYIHLTIKTIINQCGEDFNICLIDDESFSRLLPDWNIEISTMAEPMKSQFRELAMIELLYIYGGIIVPNSFVCSRNLLPLYKKGIERDLPFVCENVNRTMNVQDAKRLFIPDINMIGAKKRDPIIKETIDYLKIRNQNPHFNNESDFVGYTAQWCLSKIALGKMMLIGGESIGVKTIDGKTILLEDIMEEKMLNLCPKKNFGVLIPREEILARPKYQWFAVLSSDELLKTNMFITRFLKSAIVSSQDKQPKNSDKDSLGNSRTVISI